MRDNQSANSWTSQEDKIQIGQVNKANIPLIRRKVNPVLKPIKAPLAPDPNLSKHTFSEHNSVISEDEGPTNEEVEEFLRTTKSKMSALKEEFKSWVATGERPSSAGSQQNKVETQHTSANPSSIIKPDTTRKRLLTSNLDSLLTNHSIGVNSLAKNSSKPTFTIKGRQQRSLSRNKQ